MKAVTIEPALDGTERVLIRGAREGVEFCHHCRTPWQAREWCRQRGLRFLEVPAAEVVRQRVAALRKAVASVPSLARLGLEALERGQLVAVRGVLEHMAREREEVSA